MADTLVRDFLDEFSALRLERTNWEGVWADIKKYVVPHRTGFEEDAEKGKREDEEIYDGTPLSALNLYASGSQGYLLSANFKWFGLRVPQEQLMDVREVRMWLSYVEQVLYGLIQRSNFYNQIYQLFRDGGAFGTASLYCSFDRATGREWFQTLHPKRIYVAEDKTGEVDTVFDFYRMSAKKMVEEFDETELHPEVVKLNEDTATRYTEQKILRIVRPRGDFDPNRRDRRAKKFGSWYIDYDHEHLMREGGHDVMPYAVWRLEKGSDESYGRGPGWTALGDIKALYEYAKTDIEQAQIVVAPPLDIPAEREGDILYVSGGHNYYEDASRQVHVMEHSQNLRAGLDREERKQAIIEREFMVDFFLMMAQAEREMTATEIRQRREEKAVILGPHITGLNQDILDRVIDRVFQDAWNTGMIPPPPQILLATGQHKLEVDYMGPLAQTQRSYFHSEPYRRSLEDIAALAQLQVAAGLRASIMDNYDWDYITREMSKAAGMPEEGMLDERTRDAIRKQIAQQQQAAQTAERLQQIGKAVPGLNQPVEEGSILEQVEQQAVG